MLFLTQKNHPTNQPTYRHATKHSQALRKDVLGPSTQAKCNHHQMWVQNDPSLLCGQETFLKSGPPTLPAKQIQIDQIVLNLVTHYGFKAAGARKGAQNSSLFLNRSCGEKIHLNRLVGVASHFNQVAGGSLAGPR